MVRSYLLTLDGTAQQLSAALGPNVGRTPCKQVLLLLDASAANPCYVGHDNTVAATTAGLRIHNGVNTPVSIGPFETGAVDLQDLWVKGTNTQKLGVFIVPL